MSLNELRHHRDLVAKTLMEGQPKVRDRLTVIAQQKPGWERTYEFLLNKLKKSLRPTLIDYVKWSQEVAKEEKLELERLKSGPDNSENQS
jgi:hypothetical protein